MYMDGTLPRLGCLNCVQNVYKLLLYKCTQNQFTVPVYPKLCANWLALVEVEWLTQCGAGKKMVSHYMSNAFSLYSKGSECLIFAPNYLTNCVTYYSAKIIHQDFLEDCKKVLDIKPVSYLRRIVSTTLLASVQIASIDHCDLFFSYY